MRKEIIVKAEQIRRGILYFSSLRERKPTSVGIYTTTRCNSRCKTCSIWKKQEKEDISLKAVKNILTEENLGTQYFLTGGEFILHPRYEQILRLFKDKNYVLLSNGIAASKLFKTVKKFNVKRVVLSFDGLGETYQKVRGCDNFDNLHELIHNLKKICTVSLNFTINPLNNKKFEIIKAFRFAEKHGVYLALGIYNEVEYFETKLPQMKIPDLFIKRPYPLNKYLSLYNKWLEGSFRLPCLSIRNNVVVLPNGDVSLCQGKNVILGNLNKKSLKKVWNSPQTRQKQDEFFFCNDCWLLCQKPMDIVIYDLAKILPKKLLPQKFRRFFANF